MTQTKDCALCGATFERHPKYSRRQWEEARFCSQRCSKIKPDRLPFCGCGCGQKVGKPYNKFLRGHSRGHFVRDPVRFSRPLGRWVVISRDRTPVYWARVVMEDALGRPLTRSEIVHHINGDPTDDRPENLQLFSSQSEHMRHHYEQGDCWEKAA